MARKVYGTTWWGKKWLEALTGIDNENRIPRGLSYARTGKVFDLALDINHHKISAGVRGSYNYNVEISFNLVSRERVKAFMDQVAKDVEVVSLLTNRELSPRLFDIANSCNLQIFPTSWRDLHMKCDCPDYAVPCKHIAAVIYEASQLFDANPELIFKLIGIDLQAELESRQVFSVGASASHEVPKFHERYLQSLIGSEQLKELAVEHGMNLNLVTLDDHEAKILYQDPQLITYDAAKDGVIFDEQLREAFKFQHEQQELVSSYAHTLEQTKEEIEACKANIAEKETFLKQNEKQLKTLQAKKKRNYYEQARLTGYITAQQEADKEKTRLQELTERYAKLQEQQREAQDKFDSVSLKNEQAFSEQLTKQQEQLRLGYDVQAEQARLAQEAQAVAEHAAQEQHLAEEQNAAKSVLSDFDAIDSGDDGSTADASQDLATVGSTAGDDASASASASASAEAGAAAGVNADKDLKIRRYMGSIEQLEQLTYELQIPDLSAAVLQLFSENAAGYAEGNLRAQVDSTLEAAAKLAVKQLADRNDRDFVVFGYENQQASDEGETASDAESDVDTETDTDIELDDDASLAHEGKKLKAKKVVADEDTAEAEEVTELADLPPVTLRKARGAKAKAKEAEAAATATASEKSSAQVASGAAGEVTTPAEGNVLGLIADPSKFIPRGKIQLATAVAALKEQYNQSTDKFYKNLIVFLHANIDLYDYVPKSRGPKPKVVIAALQQEQVVMPLLLWSQAERLAALGLQLPVARFDKDLQVLVYACALYAMEHIDEFRAFVLRRPELLPEVAFLYKQGKEITASAVRVKQKLSELVDMGFDANMFSGKVIGMYISQMLLGVNSVHSAQILMEALPYIISLANADDDDTQPALVELLRYSARHPLMLQSEQSEQVGQVGQVGQVAPNEQRQGSTASADGVASAGHDDADDKTEQLEKNEDPYAREKQAVLAAATLGLFDSASPNFKPWKVNPKDLKVSVRAEPVFQEAAKIVLKGERFPQKELEQLPLQQMGDPLRQFSSLPLESRGYFAHRPLFYWDKHALQFQVCTPMSVLTFNRGQERRYDLYVLPQQATESGESEQELKQRAKVLSKKNLVDAMYQQLAANKPIKILKGGSDFAKYIVQPRHLDASQDNAPAGLYEMFSGFTSMVKDKRSRNHFGKNDEKISEQSLEIRILYCLWFIASNLVKTRAIMPLLLVNDADAMQCSWLPATISPEVKELVTKVGVALQGYEHFLFNRLDRQYYLHPQFLGEILLAPFIQSYLSWARDIQLQKKRSASAYDEEERPTSDLDVIFSGMELPLNDLSSEDYELTGIRYRLENWLSPVNISTEQRYIPVLRLVDLGDYDSVEDTIFSRMSEEINSEAELTSAQQQEKVEELMRSATEATRNFIKQTIAEQEVESDPEPVPESAPEAKAEIEPEASAEDSEAENTTVSARGGGRWRRMRAASHAAKSAARGKKAQDADTKGTAAKTGSEDAAAKSGSEDAAAANADANSMQTGEAEDTVKQCGVGLEMGFMGFEPDVYAHLAHSKGEYENDIADTGFVPLWQILSDDAFKHARQYCMSTIARFSFLVPSLNKLFNSDYNVSLLPLDELYQLLNVASSTLKMLGVRLILPKSLSQLMKPAAVMKLGLNKEDGEKINSKSFMSLQSMLNFRWQVAVGDHVLNGDEFKLLMANAGQVVRFKSGFVYADVDMLRRIQDNFQKLQTLSTSKQALLEAVLTGSFKDNASNYGVVLSDQLRESLDHVLETDEIELPKGLKKDTKLRSYQVRGYEWLVRNARIQLGSILADDMGLGKTLQVITALLRFKEEQFITPEHPALVIVPTSLLTNWNHEINHYSEGMSIYTYYGADSDIQGVKSDIILTSYGTARTRIAELRKWHFGALVIDEAQNIKNRSTELHKALSSLKADHFIAMSGTPVENRLLEYYSVLDFVNRGLFGTESSFNKNFAEPIEINRDPEALKRFKLLTAPFIMRRLKTDKKVIDDLPEKIITDQFCSLTPTQASLYQSVVDSKMKELEHTPSEDRRALVFSLIQGLKAVCNSPSQYSPNNPDYDPADSGKVERLLELLAEVLDNGGKVLIFTQSVVMGKYLQEIIGKQFKRRPSFLHGGLNPMERGDLVHKFQNDAQERIMLLSLKAGGTGFNLTAANTVIHFDLWWNPAVENQATDRAFRIGQKRTVMVYRFVCSHTFEERINEMIQSKRDLADLAVVSGENWIGNLSNRQINDLFSLQEEE